MRAHMPRPRAAHGNTQMPRVSFGSVVSTGAMVSNTTVFVLFMVRCGSSSSERKRSGAVGLPTPAIT